MEKYEVLSKIGSGSFGTVWKIKRKADKRLLVWKEMDYGKMNEKEKQQLVNEVNILREFQHPGIVRYYDRIIDKAKAKIYVVMEYCEGGDLQEYIKRKRRERKFVDEAVIWKVFSQLVAALRECHEKPGGKVLHRDLKPGNVLLDDECNVKLADFGLARVMGSNSLFAHTYVGTPYYMSPEQVAQRGYNEKSDIWSLGCLVYELAALNPPFDAHNQIALAAKIKEGRFSRIPSQYSPDLFKVISQMLNVEQYRRPSASALAAVPNINAYIQAKNLTDRYHLVKRREEDVKKREDAVTVKEKQLADKEKELVERERALMAGRFWTKENDGPNAIPA
eukprot:GCRY01003359.1.p1 GENE.GCRY01003359.1~~GCRY01003359.1.p1  ORF type:complete len:335 (+),score=62.84 GCRY01003359.1:177-1181(+)